MQSQHWEGQESNGCFRVNFPVCMYSVLPGATSSASCISCRDPPFIFAVQRNVLRLYTVGLRLAFQFCTTSCVLFRLLLVSSITVALRVHPDAVSGISFLLLLLCLRATSFVRLPQASVLIDCVGLVFCLPRTGTDCVIAALLHD